MRTYTTAIYATLALTLLASLLATPAAAQTGVFCSDQSTLFPYTSHGWTIQQGNQSGNEVRSNAPLSGVVSVRYRLGGNSELPISAYSVRVQVYRTNPFPDPPVLTIAASNLDLGTYRVVARRYWTTTLAWQEMQLYLQPISIGPTYYLFFETTASPLDQVAIRVIEVCASSQVDITATSTGTLTPSPTVTTPPITATPTDTPIPTDTPTPTTGPSPTPGPTSTAPPPTGTALPGPAISTRSVFRTIPAPSSCNDPFNPCGVNPFPRIDMPTLAIASPQPYTPYPTYSGPSTFAPFSTPTGVSAGTGTPSGTGTGTPSGTGTPGLANLGNLAGTLAAQPTGFGINGTPMAVAGLATQIAGAGQFVGVAKGVTLLGRNKVYELLLFLFLCVMFAFAVHMAIFFLPSVIRIIQYVLEIIRTFKPL
jgi:hypothetical protein